MQKWMKNICLYATLFISLYAKCIAQAPLPLGENFTISPDAVVYALGGKPAISNDGTNFFVVWSDSRDLETNGPDIYGTRITPEGTVLDASDIVISTFVNQDSSPGAQYVPSVGFDGANYLVVWTAHRSPDADYEVYAARVTPDGTVIDPEGIQITDGASPLRMPSIAFDGVNYLVTWRTANSEIRAARISPSGVNLDGPTGFLVGSGFYPYVACDDTNCLVVWHNHGANALDIFGARVSREGVVLDQGGFLIHSAVEDQDHAAVAFDGASYLVVWGDHRRGNKYNGTTYGVRVSTAGVVLDSAAIKIAEYSLSGAGSGTGDALVVFDGTDHFVAWNTYNFPADFRAWDIYGARVAQDGAVLDRQGIPIGTSFGHQFNPVIDYFSDKYLLVWTEVLSSGRCAQLCGQLLQKQAYNAPSPAPTVAELPVGSWVEQISPTAGLELHAVWGFNKDNVYAVGEGSSLYKFNGDQWASVAAILPFGRGFGIWGFDADDVWAIGWLGQIGNYDGNDVVLSGVSIFIEDRTFESGYALWGMTPATMIGVGVDGGIIKRTDDGSTFQIVESHTSVDLSDLWGNADDDIYAVGEYGTILHYDGSNWDKISAVPTIQSLNGVWGTGADDIFAVGDFGTILHYDGSVWNAQYAGTTEHLTDVFGLGPSQVFAVGFNGTILRYDGVKWDPDMSNTTASLEGVWGNDDTVWAVGDEGVIVQLVLPDTDIDDITDDIDNCPTVSNPLQTNTDGDDSGDDCDSDDDNDSVTDASDNCPVITNADQTDNDEDDAGDICDPDDDNDGYSDTDEAANGTSPIVSGETPPDNDGDLTSDLIDPDDDNDGVPDAADAFPLDHAETADTDGDGVGNNADNCPRISNANQLDNDGDGVGNACEEDDFINILMVIIKSLAQGNHNQ